MQQLLWQQQLRDCFGPHLLPPLGVQRGQGGLIPAQLATGTLSWPWPLTCLPSCHPGAPGAAYQTLLWLDVCEAWLGFGPGYGDRVQGVIVNMSRQRFSLFAGPSIVTPPKDIWNVTGAQIYLSCEVIGIPTPVLIWNKIIRGQYGVQRMELLPGDRENLAIQTRGGPEKHEVTGWVLISPLSKEDAGEYECHASNAKGEATASAKIHVVETLHEIALTKDDGAEL
nr:PREDICTED: insulin-like growth factor-binding protein 7 [Struthio camelus australis]